MKKLIVKSGGYRCIFVFIMATKEKMVHEPAACAGRMLAIRDTVELLSGKWKIQIIGTLVFETSMKFMELKRNIPGIGAKMLSKELQELEINQLITRTVCDTKPITVEYKITPYGLTLEPIIAELAVWGSNHRKHLFSTSN
ncbi:helix-turn-helix domain-containing protein [Fluviicola taffensis]|uniref:winged helix-turn-helix transcriptional regulator n=1 Tax=Fluviicola taffensis TaxID=191579 RepID=UPI00315DBF6C